jgi:hypothetical protein
VTACRLLHDVNIIGQLDSEAAAIPHNVAPLVAKVGNNVIAFKRKLSTPVGLEDSGGEIELCVAAGDERAVMRVSSAFEVGGRDVGDDVAASGEEDDAEAAVEEHLVGCEGLVYGGSGAGVDPFVVHCGNVSAVLGEMEWGGAGGRKVEAGVCSAIQIAKHEGYVTNQIFAAAMRF